MSSYVVLARKWRPAQFADIVGQGAIVRTLNNAIRAQRIHQAYLFTGTRGIGKTSIARIFAKVIRCEKTQELDSYLKSCDQCTSCLEIAAGSSVDVIEIDGASNNGVEAVREIRENAKYMPSSGSRKIYIIDEVHMLTTAAFNALLKTLEEPPPHVIFIFATTEPHKIPATILSRCQRFDYRRVTPSQVQARLLQITQAEGISADPQALALLARAADGSMRDALSLLDQVIAFSGKDLTLTAVRDSIGLIESQVLLKILEGIFSRKPLDALQWADQVYERGQDLKVLTRSLIEFLHACLLAKIQGKSSYLELSQEEWQELQTVTQTRELEEIELIFQVFHRGLEWIAHSPQPKLVFDSLIIKCATADALVTLDASHSATQQTQAQPQAQVQPPAQMPTKPTQPQQPIVSHPKPPAAAVASPLPPPAQPTPATDKTWENFIEHVRQTRPLLASILEHANTAQIPTGTETVFKIYFSPQDTYFQNQLQSKIYQEQLSHLSKEFLGRPVRFQTELKEAGESLISKREREQKERIDSIRHEAQHHPILQEAKSLFGGDLSPIQISENPNVSS